MTLTTITVQTTLQSQPSTPDWMGEVAAFAQILNQTSLLTAITERVRFARCNLTHKFAKTGRYASGQENGEDMCQDLTNCHSGI